MQDTGQQRRVWQLYRVDTHGNEFDMPLFFKCKAAAEQKAEYYNQLGHHQGYFVKFSDTVK